ncbi:hypothetical protein AVEN_49430-1 [Araneus ventricosus]|uniref:Uncharacterized protein n=1 Tax=Araneus ventricosus TaxID=182803 RepID=A0A4Y2CQH5_ARAVE|nr:hypothetical protein AVEN_49430-1 [Araneus ventricosus]
MTSITPAFPFGKILSITTVGRLTPESRCAGPTYTAVHRVSNLKPPVSETLSLVHCRQNPRRKINYDVCLLFPSSILSKEIPLEGMTLDLKLGAFSPRLPSKNGIVCGQSDCSYVLCKHAFHVDIIKITLKAFENCLSTSGLTLLSSDVTILMFTGDNF